MTDSPSAHPCEFDPLLATVLDCWRREFDHEDGDAIDLHANSDFFELGGDSLAAMGVAAALGTELGLGTATEAEIVLELFEHGTPQLLRDYLERRVRHRA